MSYTIFIKVFFGLFWKKFRVREHSFDGNLNLILEDGTILSRPYANKPYKLSPEYYRQYINPPQQPEEKKVDPQELIKLREQLNIELRQSEEMKAKLAEIKNLQYTASQPTQEQVAESRARERLNQLVGEDQYAQNGSGRVLQGATRPEPDFELTRQAGPGFS
jgi:small nuclear ribonucleoprotein (snRNP)-like protein